MKKVIISTVIILIAIMLIALIFDWGRKEIGPLDLNKDIIATSTMEQYFASTTINMPIIVNNIKDNQEVSNPIKIEGKARGGWFFEATFPIQLIDTNGNIIASTTARAESDWMTTDFVSFSAVLEYANSTTTGRALIVLSKDNPSDNPEFDQSIFIPVILK